MRSERNIHLLTGAMDEKQSRNTPSETGVGRRRYKQRQGQARRRTAHRHQLAQIEVPKWPPNQLHEDASPTDTTNGRTCTTLNKMAAVCGGQTA